MTHLAKKKAILWDNDGVLVNSEQLFYKTNREFFYEMGIDLTPQNFFDWYLHGNCGAWHLLNVPDEQIAELRAERNIRHQRSLAQAAGLQIAGIDQVLAQMPTHLRMGIVTSARRVDFMTIHAKLNLLPHFEFVLAEGDYAQSKPAPDPYLAGIERLALAAHDCLHHRRHRQRSGRCDA